MPRLLTILLLLVLSSLSYAQERDLNWVLDRYVEAAGGRVNLKELTSVVIEGTLTVPDQSPIGIKVFKKRPNYVRQVMNHLDGRRSIIAYNGETVWQLVSDRRREEFSLVEGKQASAFIRDARLENPLAAAGFDKSLLKYHGLIEIEKSIECHHIELAYPDGSTTNFYIDTQTFLERKTVKQEPSEDGEMITTETYPSDFQFFNGVLFAQRLVINRADGTSTVLTIDHVRINPGIPSRLFSPPPEY